MKQLYNPLDESMRKRDWIDWSADGSYVERWDQGFRRNLYHGRTGAYFRSETTLGYQYEQWTLPELLIGDNSIGEAPWTNALRMRNSQNGVDVDELYVGFPRAHHNQVMCFEAYLPAAAPKELYMGFEVNSGGAFALIACLTDDGVGGWRLIAKNYGSGELVNAVALRHGGAWAYYALVYAPSRDTGTAVASMNFQLWQAPVASANGYPLELTDTLSLDPGGALPYVMGKTIPFFANENDTSVCEFRVGDIWIYDLPPKDTV